MYEMLHHLPLEQTRWHSDYIKSAATCLTYLRGISTPTVHCPLDFVDLILSTPGLRSFLWGSGFLSSTLKPSCFKSSFPQGKPFRACPPFRICRFCFPCHSRIDTGNTNLRLLSFFLRFGSPHVKKSFPSIKNHLQIHYNCWTLFLLYPDTVIRAT